jgi:hypothetical protein
VLLDTFEGKREMVHLMPFGIPAQAVQGLDKLADLYLVAFLHQIFAIVHIARGQMVSMSITHMRASYIRPSRSGHLWTGLREAVEAVGRQTPSMVSFAEATSSPETITPTLLISEAAIPDHACQQLSPGCEGAGLSNTS